MDKSKKKRIGWKLATNDNNVVVIVDVVVVVVVLFNFGIHEIQADITKPSLLKPVYSSNGN